MNRADSRRFSDTISSAGSMTLFLLFAVCCLIIIAAAASAYSRISSNYEDTFNSAAAVRYVTNKLRACQSAEIAGENVIILSDEGYKTVIYEKDGTIYERLVPDGREVSAEDGEAVFRADGYTVTDCGSGLVSISAEGDGGRVFTAYCRIPEGGVSG